MIGERVQMFRVLRKYTQHRLAVECGLSQGTISKIEHGVLHPTAAQLQRLAQALECEVETLTTPPPPGMPLFTILVNTVQAAEAPLTATS